MVLFSATCPSGLNVAVTELSASIVKVQGEAGPQALAEPVPLRPASWEPAAGVALTSTSVPLGCGLAQVPKEPAPPNLYSTAPVPLPFLTIVRVRGIRLKVAVTVVFSVIVKEQALVPRVQLPVAEPLPLSAVSSEPAFSVALTSTSVPLGCGLAQVPKEPAPPNLHSTAPVPLPFLTIVRVRGIRLKVAVTVVFSVIVKEQALVPRVQLPVAEPLPLSAVSSEPAFSVALTSTSVPLGCGLAQVPKEPAPPNLHSTAPV